MIIKYRICPHCKQRDIYPVSLHENDASNIGFYICSDCMHAWDLKDLEFEEVSIRGNIEEEDDEITKINKLKQNLHSVI